MLCLAPLQRSLQLNDSILHWDVHTCGRPECEQGMESQVGCAWGSPVKVNDLLQSAQENETQRYSLPVTTGTPLSKKQICHTEKKCCWQGGDATPWRMSPASPKRKHSRVQPSMPMVYLYFWQGAPARRHCGNITQPIAAPYQQTHQAHKTADEVDPMMPGTLPDLTETLLPITSRDALPAPQCTRVRGPSPACPGRGCDPAACRNPPLTRCCL